MEQHFSLTGYFRSTTSYRVRIALNLKGIAYRKESLALLKREHRREEFLEINPQGFVPVLQVDEAVLLQSPAILEWLEESHPEPPLLPRDLLARQRVRAIAAVIGCDIHPLNNLRVLNQLRQEFAATDEAVSRWIKEWISVGFAALETLLGKDTAREGYCFGNAPTLADCYLVPQVYSARRFGVDMAAYPLIGDVEAHCEAMAAFAAASPERQPDSPAKV